MSISPLNDRLTIIIPKVLKNELKDLADIENRSLSNYVVNILETHVKNSIDTETVIRDSFRSYASKGLERDESHLRVAEAEGKYDVDLDHKYDDSDKSKSTSEFVDQYMKDYNSDQSIEKLKKKLRTFKCNN